MITTTKRAGLVAAALATLVVPTIVSGPAGSASAREDDALGTKESVATDVEIVAKTFDWDVESTAKHLEDQLTFGALANTVSTKYAKNYAGASFAENPGDTSLLYIKGRTPRDVARLVAETRLPIEIVDGQKYSHSELNDRSNRVVGVLAEAGYADVNSAVMADGSIQVAVAGKPKHEPKLDDDLRDGVTIVQGPERISNDEVDIEGGRQVYATSGGQCTSGFSVRRLSDGLRGITTAAHCTGINRYTAPGPDVVLSHRGEHNGFFGDVEWKSSAEPEVDNYWASPTQLRDVSSVWPVGSFVENLVTCVHSRMQGTRSCDRVYSVSVSSGSSSNLVAMDNDNTVNGDSGGPWSFGTIADGIHKGDKWIWFGTRNVFSKAAFLPAALGVEVLT